MLDNEVTLMLLMRGPPTFILYIFASNSCEVANVGHWSAAVPKNDHTDVELAISQNSQFISHSHE